MHLQKIAHVHNAIDHLAHIVRLARFLRHDAQQLLVAALGVVSRLDVGRVFHVVQWQEREQAAHLLQAVLVAVDREVADAAA